MIPIGSLGKPGSLWIELDPYGPSPPSLSSRALPSPREANSRRGGGVVHFPKNRKHVNKTTNSKHRTSLKHLTNDKNMGNPQIMIFVGFTVFFCWHWFPLVSVPFCKNPTNQKVETYQICFSKTLEFCHFVNRLQMRWFEFVAVTLNLTVWACPAPRPFIF